MALRRAAAPAARRSSSSSRARQSSSSGARTHCARCSIASSMPSSAQWMSSKASTRGRRARRSLDHGAQRGEERLAHPLGVAARPPARARPARRDPASARSARRGARAPRSASPTVVAGRSAHSLRPRLVGAVGVHDARLAAHHLAERPVDDARAVGQAAARAQPGVRVAGGRAALELAQQARLAHAGLADQRDHVRAALARDPRQTRLERAQLLRRGPPAATPPTRPSRRRAAAITPVASHAGTGSALPFSVSGSQLA